MSDRSAERLDGAVQPEQWWRSRRVTWPLGSVAALFLLGALSSGLFPDSLFASLVTGMAWSLAVLTLLVLGVGYGGARLRARRR